MCVRACVTASVVNEAEVTPGVSSRFPSVINWLESLLKQNRRRGTLGTAGSYYWQRNKAPWCPHLPGTATGIEARRPLYLCHLLISWRQMFLAAGSGILLTWASDQTLPAPQLAAEDKGGQWLASVWSTLLDVVFVIWCGHLYLEVPQFAILFVLHSCARTSSLDLFPSIDYRSLNLLLWGCW